MTESVEIDFDGVPLTFGLDFENWRWSGEPELPEGDFPLTAEVDEKRYELYSDGTFAEVEV